MLHWVAGGEASNPTTMRGDSAGATLIQPPPTAPQRRPSAHPPHAARCISRAPAACSHNHRDTRSPLKRPLERRAHARRGRSPASPSPARSLRSARVTSAATMAGTIRPNEINVSTTPVLASKTLPGLTDLLKSEAKKPSLPRAPRVDVEPLYTAVKSAISDSDWTTYKASLSSFLLGNLNQEELSQRLDRILTTRELEHAHNALILAIYVNVWRDAPEPGIASWVSSSDKPSSGVVKGAGDESEKRLKHEVMQLSRRERKRLKTIHQDSRAFDPSLDVVGGVMAEYQEARKAKLPEAGPASVAGGYQKTSKCTHRSQYSGTWPLTHAHYRLGPRDSQTLHLLALH